MVIKNLKNIWDWLKNLDSNTLVKIIVINYIALNALDSLMTGYGLTHLPVREINDMFAQLFNTFGHEKILIAKALAAIIAAKVFYDCSKKNEFFHGIPVRPYVITMIVLLNLYYYIVVISNIIQLKIAMNL